MWRVTFADLAYRYRQFLIAVVGAGVVLAMALLLAGLAAGFTQEIDDGGRRRCAALGARSNADGRISALSVFSQAAAAAIANSTG